MNAHGPYRVPEEHQADLLGRSPRPGFRDYGNAMKAILREGRLGKRQAVGEALLTSLDEQYDTAVRYTLDQLAARFRSLERRGLYDDALIVLTSDHGEELFEHGGFSHGYSLHEELLRVPLSIKLPKQRTGVRVTSRVSLADVTPTVLDAVGLTWTTEALLGDGRSLLPILEPRPGAMRRSRPTPSCSSTWTGPSAARRGPCCWATTSWWPSSTTTRAWRTCCGSTTCAPIRAKRWISQPTNRNGWPRCCGAWRHGR